MRHSSPLFRFACMCGMMALVAVTSLPSQVNAQDALTLQQAFERALQHNHAIQIEQLAREQSRNAMFRGNAGQLPTLELSGNASLSRNDTELQLADFNPDGPPGIQRISVDGAESRSLAAGVELNYTIFDGFSGRYRYRQLQSQDRITRLATRLVVENTLLEVAQAYFEVLRTEEQLEIVQKTLALSETRLENTREAQRFGNARQLDVLNAEVNVNTDRIAREEAGNERLQAKRELLYLLGMEMQQELPLTDTFELQQDLPLDELMAAAFMQNVMVRLSEEELTLAEVQRRLQGSGRFPRLSAQASYGYFRQENDANVLRSVEETGYTAMLTLRYSLFDGGVTRRSVQNAAIAQKSREERKGMVLLEVEKELMNAYSRFQTQLRQLDIAELNVRTAELNFENARETIQVGRISSIELREAQLNLQQARLAQSSLTHGLKQQEMRLLLISGSLLE